MNDNSDENQTTDSPNETQLTDTVEIDVNLTGASAVSILDDYSSDNTDYAAELVTVTFTVPTTGNYTLEFSVDPGGENLWNHANIDAVVLVPEPATLLFLGLGGLFLKRRKP